MTREEAKILYAHPVWQAFISGKEIEIDFGNEVWLLTNTIDPTTLLNVQGSYRIKPTNDYNPIIKWAIVDNHNTVLQLYNHRYSAEQALPHFKNAFNYFRIITLMETIGSDGTVKFTT